MGKLKEICAVRKGAVVFSDICPKKFTPRHVAASTFHALISK